MIQARISLDTITPPLTFNIFILTLSPHTFVAEYAEDKAILSFSKNVITTSYVLQSHIFLY